ncbi:malate synthase-like [Periplaneta americana]|uniref:malate synthase-like n=1 Tax=Periplaneta americana TaxID=6978 RepID=UPI0037E796BA
MAADTASTARRIRVLNRILQPTHLHTEVNLNPTSVSYGKVTPVVHVEAPPKGLEEVYEILLTPSAVQFVAELVETFDKQVDELHWYRLNRKCNLRRTWEKPQFMDSAVRTNKYWKVAQVPKKLRNRHLDLGDVSPTNIEHFTQSLLADVQGIQVDFDDGHCPTWRNQIIGLYNVYRAVHNLIPAVPTIDSAPVLMLRPRAWNMVEHNMLVNGKEVPGPLFDFGLLMFHNAQALFKAQSGPFFYLSKVEGVNEAQLWNQIFVWAQEKLSIPHGTIKACVLIENILSSYEMEEILYALKDHSLGLNCGIWDYAASIICKFGDNKTFLLPDRNKYVNMERHFLKCYMQLVIQTCHQRGAYATGGMAALLLPLNDPESEAAVVDKVCRGKLQEIQEGVDGFMVYDLRLVPHINKLWRDNAPPVNQLSVTLKHIQVTAEDLLQMPSGGVTYAGLIHNITVAILFILNWFQGRGHFYHRGAVEDSATAEISRSQIWQWIRHQASMEDYDAIVTKGLVNRLVSNFIQECKAGKHPFFHPTDKNIQQLEAAAGVFMEIVTKREFPEFITTYLNDSYIFWSFQKHNE